MTIKVHPVMLTIEPRMGNEFWAWSLIFFKHMSFWSVRSMPTHASLKCRCPIKIRNQISPICLSSWSMLELWGPSPACFRISMCRNFVCNVPVLSTQSESIYSHSKCTLETDVASDNLAWVIADFQHWWWYGDVKTFNIWTGLWTEKFTFGTQSLPLLHSIEMQCVLFWQNRSKPIRVVGFQNFISLIGRIWWLDWCCVAW